MQEVSLKTVQTPGIHNPTMKRSTNRQLSLLTGMKNTTCLPRCQGGWQHKINSTLLSFTLCQFAVGRREGQFNGTHKLFSKETCITTKKRFRETSFTWLFCSPDVNWLVTVLSDSLTVTPGKAGGPDNNHAWPSRAPFLPLFHQEYLLVKILFHWQFETEVHARVLDKIFDSTLVMMPI